MAVVKNLLVRAGADFSELQKEMNKAQKYMKTAGKQLTSVGKSLTKSVTLPLVAIGTASVKLASDFEDSMAKVRTIAGDASTEYNGSMQSMSDAILQLSNDTGIAATDCAEATYQAVSAGVDAGKSVQFVAEANKLATGGFTDLTTATDTLTTAMNAYGLGVDDVSGISDKLITTQNLGKTSVNELGSAMGRVIPTAAAYGVNIDNLCAGYVKMTANGVSTAESTTYLSSMLNELGKSSTGVAKVLKQQTGKSFSDLVKSGKSVGDVLQILQDYCGKTGTQFTDLWGSAEAGKAALILAKDGADGFNATLKEMAGSTGATDSAFKKMQTTSWTLNKVVNEVKNTAIDLGNTLMQVLGPIIKGLCDKVEAFTKWFKNLNEGQKETIVKVGMLAAAAGPLLTVLGKAATGISSVIGVGSKLIKAFTAVKAGTMGLGGALTTVLGPGGVVILVIAGITALVAGIKWLWDNCEGFRNAVTAIGEGIRNFFAPIIDGAKAKIAEFQAFIQSTILPAVQSYMQQYQENAQKTWAFIQPILSTIKDFIVNTWNNICTTVGPTVQALCEFLIALWNNVKVGLGVIWDVIVVIFKTALAVIQNVVSVVSAVIQTIWSAFGSSILAFIKGIWSAITSVFKGAFQIIQGIFQIFTGLLSGNWSKCWEGVKNVVGGAWNAIKGIVKGGISAITGFFKNIHLPEIKIPHIKLPHFSISGKFSLSPPQIPHIGCDWYSSGAIFTKPTLLGNIGVGDAFNGSGSNPEGIIPLDQLWSQMKANAEKIANRPVQVIIDGRECMVALAPYQSELQRYGRGR